MSSIHGSARVTSPSILENNYSQLQSVVRKELYQEPASIEIQPLDPKTKDVEKTAFSVDQLVAMVTNLQKETDLRSKKLEDQFNESRLENQQLKDQVKKNGLENQELKEQFNESRLKNKQLEDQLKEKTASLEKKLEVSDKKAEENYKRLYDENQKAQKKIKKLQDRIITLEQIVVEKEKQILEKDGKIKDLLERVNQLVKEKEVLSKEKIALNSDNEKLTQNLDLKEKKIVELELDKKTKEDKIIGFESRQSIEEQLQNGLQAQYNKNEELLKQNELLKQQLNLQAVKAHENVELQQQNELLKQQLNVQAEKARENEQLKQQLNLQAEKAHENEKLLEKIKRLEAEVVIKDAKIFIEADHNRELKEKVHLLEQQNYQDNIIQAAFDRVRQLAVEKRELEDEKNHVMQNLKGWYKNFKDNLPIDLKDLIVGDKNEEPVTCQEYFDSMKKVQEKLSTCVRDLYPFLHFFEGVGNRLVQNGLLSQQHRFSKEKVEESLNHLVVNRDQFKNEFKQMCQELNLPEDTTPDTLKDEFNNLKQQLQDFEVFKKQIIEILVDDGYLVEGEEYELDAVQDAFSNLIIYEHQLIENYKGICDQLEIPVGSDFEEFAKFAQQKREYQKIVQDFGRMKNNLEIPENLSIEGMEEEFKQNKQNAATARLQTQALTSERNELRKVNTALRKTIAELRQSNTGLSEQVGDYVHDQVQSTNQIAYLKEQLEKLQIELKGKNHINLVIGQKLTSVENSHKKLVSQVAPKQTGTRLATGLKIMLNQTNGLAIKS